ncbi:MAG TPA: hypothetical protein VLF21_02085 [Candidatus Saccharimonadales bacterium]|nr:hypothetical protein [Candidatus Saccharimonadales bacterium]
MAKRKKTKKKVTHKNRPVSQSNTASSKAFSDVVTNPEPEVEVKKPITVANSTTNYVISDVVRIGALVVFFVVLQLGLWLAFNHSDLGKSVYGLIKI